jgi:hydroxymethylbilane synthase
MTSSHSIRLGTRGSQLALYQAHTVARLLDAAGGPTCEIVIIKTSGDRLQEAPLSEAGGKRLFVKEIEDALLNREIDLAVHSSKDMPAVLPDGLAIAGVLPREDPHDAVVLPVRTVRLKPDTTYEPEADTTSAQDVVSAFRRTPGDDARTVTTIDELVAILGQTPAIGTSSVRRIAQLTRLVPNARFEPIRGNLDTRLRKLDEHQYDAIVLAAAGLRRLGFERRISMALPAAACVPAPGQGIVAIEIREDAQELAALIARTSDRAAAAALDAERAVVDALGGGCQTPIGALATIHDDVLEIVATVVAPDGSRAVRAQRRGPVTDAAALGMRAGTDLLNQGAAEILNGATTIAAPRGPSHDA